jgi:hypothetical protein
MKWFGRLLCWLGWHSWDEVHRSGTVAFVRCRRCEVADYIER